MNSKGFAGCMYKSTWVFVVNAVLFLFFLISACILATNAKRFDLGSVRKAVLLLFNVFSLRTHHSEIAERCKKWTATATKSAEALKTAMQAALTLARATASTSTSHIARCMPKSVVNSSTIAWKLLLELAVSVTLVKHQWCYIMFYLWKKLFLKMHVLDNKYYVNAITACVFAFITTILYLVNR